MLLCSPLLTFHIFLYNQARFRSNATEATKGDSKGRDAIPSQPC